MNRPSRVTSALLAPAIGAGLLALGACGQDFDAFVVEGDLLPDGATATTGDSGASATTDGAAKPISDGAAPPRDAAVDAAPVDCATKAACFSTRSKCGDACEQTQSNCLDACPGGNNGCRNKCRTDGTQCTSGCTTTCKTCATAACAAPCN